MSILLRLIILVPLALSIVGTILSAVSVFAGHKEGFMEEYAIARLNVSRIGYDVISSSSNDSSKKDDDDGGFLNSIKDKWSDVKQDVTEKINDVIGDVAGDVADAVGISEWYSLHIMGACEGDYTPNATFADASYNITNCTDAKAGFRLNMTEIMDKQLDLGPFDINIADLGWDEKVQDKLDMLNKVLLGLFVLYVLGIVFSGIASLLCLVAMVFPEHKVVSIANLAMSVLSTLVLLIASIIVTVAITKGVNELNGIAEKIGVTVVKGNLFLAISWVAAVVMLFTMVFWATRYHVVKNHTKRAPRYVPRSKV